MSQDSNAYAVVIRDLKRQRDEIDRMIVQLEALASGNPLLIAAGADPGAEKPAERQEKKGEQLPPAAEGDFLGMKVVDAAKVVLRRNRKPMSPADITAHLERGGLPVAGSKTVAAVLHRRSRKVGDVVSPKRGVWGLKEWYPGRSFGKTEEADRNGPRDPCEPEPITDPTRTDCPQSHGEPQGEFIVRPSSKVS